MLTVQKPQGKIIERIVRTKAGEFVLAKFLVIEEGGKFQIKLLSVQPIAGHTFRTPEAVLLPVAEQKSPAVIAYRSNYRSVISVFSNIFEFFVSQPTRAPSAC